jgi:predicted dehydrogenase
MDLAPHDIDFVRWILENDDPVTVHGLQPTPRLSGSPHPHIHPFTRVATIVMSLRVCSGCEEEEEQEEE